MRMPRVRIGYTMTMAVAFAGGSASAGDKVDLDKLRGTWGIRTVDRNGEAWRAKDVEGGELTFKGDALTVGKRGDKPHSRATIKVVGDGSPTAIDVRWTEGPGAGWTAQGIAEFDGLVLRLCLIESDRKGVRRPEEFATQKGSGHVFLTLERAKP